jgi:hypothetical protein
MADRGVDMICAARPSNAGIRMPATSRPIADVRRITASILRVFKRLSITRK